MNATALIYLFRHGETEWNTQGRRQGHLDSPLTEKGRRQAVENARRLRLHRSFSEKAAIISSPLGRARQTAQIMAGELGIADDAIAFEPRLMECSFGEWEGMTEREIVARYPQEWDARQSDRWHVPPPSGESYAEVHSRVAEWYAETELAETILVVCHALTSKVFRGLYCGLSRQDIFDLGEPQDGFFQLRQRAAVFVG